MYKYFYLLFFISSLIITQPAIAACDQSEAKKVISLIVQSGLAERQDNPDSITVWYIWKDNWFGLPKEKRYSLISGIGGAEQCLKPGRATRIRVAGEDVARASSTGKVELLK